MAQKHTHSRTRQQSTASQRPGTRTKQDTAGRFPDFVFGNRQNRTLLLIVAGISVLFFAVYKYCIPMPDFTSDSHGYILAAVRNMQVYYRPLGYSRFLSILLTFSSSALFTVGAQYFLLVFASIFLFFTVHYLFGFQTKALKIISIALMALNPALLVVANLILSDSIFTAFTVLWFASLLWILKKGSWWALVLQVLFLYWAFEARYNALFYPAVSLLAFVLAQKVKLPYRLSGILLTLLVIGSAYRSERATTEEVTGAPVFTGFSGWMMANNALLIYPHTDIQTADFDDPDLQLMDRFVKTYIDSISPEDKADLQQNKLGWPYFWSRTGPLKRYLTYYITTNRVPYIKAWYQVSPLFYNYGKTVIVHHPAAFLRYFAIPNMGYFFFPRKVEMESYLVNNPGKLPPETKDWFGWSQDTLHGNMPGIEAFITNAYLPAHAVMMLACIVLPFLYWIARRRKNEASGPENQFYLILFWYLFFGLNLVFSILSGPIVLRYQLALFITGCSVPLWCLDWLIAQRLRAVEA